MSGSWDVKTWGACLGASEKRPTWRVVANKPLYVSRLSSSDNSRFFTRFNYVFEAIGKIQKESLKMLFDANVNPEQIVSEPLYLRHCCLLVKIGTQSGVWKVEVIWWKVEVICWKVEVIWWRGGVICQILNMSKDNWSESVIMWRTSKIFKNGWPCLITKTFSKIISEDNNGVIW